MLTLNVIVEESILLNYIPITFLMYIQLQEWQPGFDQGINRHDNGLPESLRALHNYAIGIAIHAWRHQARKFFSGVTDSWVLGGISSSILSVIFTD